MIFLLGSFLVLADVGVVLTGVEAEVWVLLGVGVAAVIFLAFGVNRLGSGIASI